MPRYSSNTTATTKIYTLSLHDALPISFCRREISQRSLETRPRISPLQLRQRICRPPTRCTGEYSRYNPLSSRSEEHTSELQSRLPLVCRHLLEEKDKPIIGNNDIIHLM